MSTDHKGEATPVHSRRRHENGATESARSGGKSGRPDVGLLVMAALVIGTGGWVFATQGLGGIQGGLVGTSRTLIEVGPEMLLGIGLAGMLQVLIPAESVSRWMGEGSGLMGIAIGVAAGLITPGGPYVLFPIAASLVSSGAGIAPLSAFVAVRNSATVNRLVVWEIPLLGVSFSLARILCSMPMAAAQIVVTPILFRMMPRGAPGSAHQRIATMRTSDHRRDI